MMNIPVLTYFNGRGKAECIRMALCAAGVEFTEIHLRTREKYLEIRDTNKSLLFGQVPLLEIDGMNLVQSRAIVNYIGRKYNLYGKNNEEATMIDMLAEAARDFYAPMIPMLFIATEEEIISKLRENEFRRYMPIFEKVLSDSGKHYLIGNSLSLADLALWEMLLIVDEFMGVNSFDEYPKLREYYNFMRTLPRMQNYLKNHRKGKNTETYIEEAKNALALVL